MLACHNQSMRGNGALNAGGRCHNSVDYEVATPMILISCLLKGEWVAGRVAERRREKEGGREASVQAASVQAASAATRQPAPTRDPINRLIITFLAAIGRSLSSSSSSSSSSSFLLPDLFRVDLDSTLPSK